jgi:hypothetical protein
MKLFRSTIETLTQCVLLPGVELKFDDVVFYFKEGVGGVLKKKAKKLKL